MPLVTDTEAFYRAATDPPSRAQLRLYRGGHMLYLDAQSRKGFSADAAAFYRNAGE